MPRSTVSVSAEFVDTAGALLLTGESRTGFHRRRTEDPTFPVPTYRGRRPFWRVEELRAYYASLTAAGPSDALREARRRAGLAGAAARRAPRRIADA